MFDRLFIDVDIATMDAAREGPYGAIPGGAIGVCDGRIAWLGAADELPGPPARIARDVVSLRGSWATPGLIDCHTHLVFAGTRADEFEQRLNGASYEEIARAGGGILSTVRATRAASIDELEAVSLGRMRRLVAAGVTTVEFKSGYGLDRQTECKMLEAGSRAAAKAGLRVRRTYLALHALPPEYAEDRRTYVDHACSDMLDMAVARGLVDAVDVFCEKIAFTRDEARRMFDAARARGLPVKIHAGQLSDMRAAGLAAEASALSADHLEWAHPEDVAAMGRAGVVAVLLPGAFYFLKETRKPPIDLFRKFGVRMAVASDFNPGSSPVLDPGVVMNLAATLFGLTPAEALAGMTRHAAAALGLEGVAGVLAVGAAADFAIWRIAQPAELVYWIGGEGPEQVFIAGQQVKGV